MKKMLRWESEKVEYFILIIELCTQTKTHYIYQTHHNTLPSYLN